MPGNAITHLRIYCICGQKMKMSSEMFGRPGKCVACRQKIRVPRQDEIPDGVDTIYLKDHPEFLRKSDRDSKSGSGKVRIGVRSAGAEAGDEDAAVAVEEEAADAPAVDTESERVSTVPIDVLDPLRNVCSVGYKLQRKLRALDKVATAKESAQRGDQRCLDHGGVLPNRSGVVGAQVVEQHPVGGVQSRFDVRRKPLGQTSQRMRLGHEVVAVLQKLVGETLEGWFPPDVFFQLLLEPYDLPVHRRAAHRVARQRNAGGV